MGLPETQNEKDERVEALWRTMNPHNKNRIDLSAFKDGLRLIDHPMKDARGLLKAVVKDMARNGEGTISYEGIYKIPRGVHLVSEMIQLFLVSPSRFKDTADMLFRLSHFC